MLVAAKPAIWGPVSRGLVAPEWRWAWDGLVLAMPFWERAGPPRDVSGNGHHGTLPGGGNDPSWILDGYGPAPLFDGAGDHFNCGDVDVAGAITIAALIQQPARVSTDDYVSKYWNYTLRVIWNKIRFVWYENPLTQWHEWWSTNEVMVSGQSAVVIVSYTYGDGASIHVSLDGVSIPGSWVVGDGNGAQTLNDNELAIGAYNAAGANPATGNVSMVLIADRAWTAREAELLAADPFGPFRRAAGVVAKAAAIAAVGRSRGFVIG